MLRASISLIDQRFTDLTRNAWLGTPHCSHLCPARSSTSCRIAFQSAGYLLRFSLLIGTKESILDHTLLSCIAGMQEPRYQWNEIHLSTYAVLARSILRFDRHGLLPPFKLPQSLRARFASPPFICARLHLPPKLPVPAFPEDGSVCPDVGDGVRDFNGTGPGVRCMSELSTVGEVKAEGKPCVPEAHAVSRDTATATIHHWRRSRPGRRLAAWSLRSIPGRAVDLCERLCGCRGELALESAAIIFTGGPFSVEGIG